jgi:hypothetical protein
MLGEFARNLGIFADKGLDRSASRRYTEVN